MNSLHIEVRRTHKFLQGSCQESRQIGGIFLCHAGPIWMSINEDWGSTCNPRKARDLLRCTWLWPAIPCVRRAELWQRALQELLVNQQDGLCNVVGACYHLRVGYFILLSLVLWLWSRTSRDKAPSFAHWPLPATLHQNPTRWLYTGRARR